MVDIPFSYYLCYSECKDYIDLSLYEVANTLKGPVISRSHLIQFFFTVMIIYGLQQIYLNLIL